ncbi:pyruvate kinase [Stygiolobus caldivivus]|uniref:Pyruvate kinase n=1 Tax=Stygiolobus caldivivus TaxID=2824673 RepID=A0A8D5U8M7_9CREN|nr:pyruvate kinase [Stygiolobus caldivivus]BCU71434.1 pyruvate kinase [Stygiolobus caldivivus]
MSKRKTKIISTLGPSSEKLVDELLKYTDVIRLNFAHGDEEQHKKYFELVGDKAPVLVDLPGPKLRIGDLENEPIILKNGDQIKFGDKGVPVEDQLFFKLIKEGTDVLIADGRIRVKITKVDDGYAEGIVKEGGILTSRKGINIPDADIPLGITQRDLELLKEALILGATYIGLSFVVSEEDIRKVKEIVSGKAWVIAKIEKKAALKNLRNIVREADGIMVARGDLGVEVGLPNLPQTQRKIVNIARAYGKPVILATQVLESMVNSPLPTRAETIDVANSISQGVDAIMLSDETAMGKFPIEAAKTLNELIISVERTFKPKRTHIYKNVDEAIAYSAVISSILSSAFAIITYTRSGSSALRISRLRPVVPVITLTPSEDLIKKLRICYGVYPKKAEELKSLDEIVKKAREEAAYLGQKGFIVVVGGVCGDNGGTTRFLKVEELD